MPCLNESGSISYAIESAKKAGELLKKKGFKTEILISDNGSTDNSVNIAENMGCRTVINSDRGYGNALIYGAKNAYGRYIIMADSDGSYDFTEAVPMIDKLLEGYDLCMGSRFKGKIMPKAMPWKNRYIGNPILTGILNIFFRSELSDAHCGIRAFTKDAFLKLRLTAGGMEFASEMVVKATLLNLRRTEVPVTLYPDLRNRKPHLKPYRDGWRHLKFLLMFSPLWLFFIPAICLFAFSFLTYITLIIFTPVGKIFVLGNLKIGDHWAILASSALIAGTQMSIFGIGSFIYSVNNQFRVLSKNKLKFYLNFRLEYALVLGFLIIICGSFFTSYLIYLWLQDSTNSFFHIRELSLSTSLIVIGLQIIFGGFFFSILGENGIGMKLASQLSKKE